MIPLSLPAVAWSFLWFFHPPCREARWDPSSRSPPRFCSLPAAFPTSVPAGKSPALPFPAGKGWMLSWMLSWMLIPFPESRAVYIDYFGGFINQTLYKVILYRAASQSWV